MAEVMEKQQKGSDLHSMAMAPTTTEPPLTMEEDAVAITSISSATAITDYDDVLSEILVRAPSKSLLRFKSVSKHWLSLISSPGFCLLHLRNSSKYRRLSSGFLISKWREPLGFDKFEFVSLINSALSWAPSLESLIFNYIQRNNRNYYFGIYLRQSCNGLLLCSTFDHSCFYILNPTTRQYIELYPPPRDRASLELYPSIHNTIDLSWLPSVYDQHKTDIFSLLQLAFDPSKSFHYKVICISVLPYGRSRIEIYSSESRRWRVVPAEKKNMVVQTISRFKEGVFWNGNINWCGVWNNEERMETGFRFDVDTECMEIMPELPVVLNWGYRFFGESNGHLHLIIEGSRQTTEFRVFEMERDYSGWFVTYHVNLGGIVDAFGFPLFAAGDDYPISILAVVREENEYESVLLLNAPGTIVSYNFKNGTLKGLLDLAPRNIGDAQKLFTQSNTYRYIETFVPV